MGGGELNEWQQVGLKIIIHLPKDQTLTFSKDFFFKRLVLKLNLSYLHVMICVSRLMFLTRTP